MRIIFLFLLLTGFIFSAEAQQNSKQIYNIQTDGLEQIKAAVNEAAAENKHVLIQVGGNWCPWCIKFYNFCQAVPAIDSLIKENYILVHLNYSKENKNLPALQQLEYPQRFGFPVLVILDNKGRRIHTQDSGFLEKDPSYDTLKVVTFLKKWTPQALNPANYQ